jgi:amidohydrolase
MEQEICSVNQNLEEYIVQIRRELHRFPEISGEEKHTIRLITNQLKEMDISFEVIENGGIIGIIEGSKPGKSIILRADFDALPMKENTHNLKGIKNVVSQNENVAHTCGHDGHTAMLLGAAKQLARHKDQITGRVILAFEQGEENGRGIYRLLKRLIEIGADGIWGIHIKPDIPSMKISVDKGPRMASLFIYKVTIKGVGGHGSRPDLANAPLDAFTDFYQQLKNMRVNTLNPFDPLTFSVGNVQTGSSHNVISDTLTFSGTFRYLHYEQGKHAEQEFKRILQRICELHGCQYEYEIEPKASDITVYNNDECTTIAQEAVQQSAGRNALYTYPAWMASETFAFYQKYFPGVFAFLGTENAKKGTGADNHHPQFDIDEDTLKLGVMVTIKNALLFLDYNKDILFEPETRDPKDLIIEAGLRIYD